jgi:hypothetical protein
MPDPEILQAMSITTPGVVPQTGFVAAPVAAGNSPMSASQGSASANAPSNAGQNSQGNLFNRNELDAIKQNVTDAVARSIRNIDL